VHVHGHSTEGPERLSELLTQLFHTSPWLAALAVCSPAIPMLLRRHFIGAAVCAVVGSLTIPALLVFGPPGLLFMAMAAGLAFASRARDAWARMEARRRQMFSFGRPQPGPSPSSRP
jgi:hypothetical protein